MASADALVQGLAQRVPAQGCSFVTASARRSDNVGPGGSIPHFGSYAPDACHQVANAAAHWHGFAANLVLILAAGHILAAIAHTLIERNGALLARMGLRFGR